MAKLDIRIKESGKDSLKIELGGRSRLLYFFIFLFLTAAVVLSIDFSYDFTSSRIGGTLFTFLLIFVCLGVTLTVRSFSVDKTSGVLNKNIGLPFGIYDKILKTYSLGVKPKFIVRSTSAYYPQDSSGAGRFTQSAGAVMAKRRGHVALCLETEEDTVTLCKGSSKEEINQIAKYLSAYLGFSVYQS